MQIELLYLLIYAIVAIAILAASYPRVAATKTRSLILRFLLYRALLLGLFGFVGAFLLWLPDQFDIIRYGVLLPTVWLLSVALFVARRIAGPIIVEFGGSDANAYYLVFGILGLTGSLSGALDDAVRSNADSLTLMQSVFRLSFAGYFVLKGFGKNALTQAGVLTISGFVAWKRIRSYAWKEGDHRMFLLLHTSGLIPSTIEVQVPLPQKETTRRLLWEYSPEFASQP